MKKNLLVVALVVVAGLLALVVVWQRRELKRLREIIAGQPVKFAPPPAAGTVTTVPANP